MTLRSMLAGPAGLLCWLGALPVLAAFSLPVAAQAADVSLESVSQPGRGQVVAHVAASGASPPQAAWFSLRLGNGPALAASSVAVASAASAAPGSAAVAVPQVALLVCLDRSGSMGPAAMAAMQGALRKALALPGQAPLPASVAIVAFATRSTRLLDLTNDPVRVDEAVGRLAIERERDGKTHLYDAVAGGLAELRAIDARAKRLVVVSDGDDEGSNITQEQLVKLAISTSIPVSAVGFGALAASQSGSLATLAGATGGDFRVAGTSDELSAQLQRMVQRTQPPRLYDVQFRYPAATDGTAAESAVLSYSPPGEPPTALPVRTSLAAASVATTQAAPANSWEGFVDSLLGLPGTIDRFFATATLLEWALVALVAVLVVAVIVLLWRRRSARRSEAAATTHAVEPPWMHAMVPPTVINPPMEREPPARRPERRTVIAHQWPSPGDGRVVAILHITTERSGTRRVDLTSARLRIGAAPDNDLVLQEDSFVSSHHVLLRAEASNLYLVDLGSRNGTELNGQRLRDTTRTLVPGDRFRMGRTEVEVTSADSSRPRPHAFEQRVH